MDNDKDFIIETTSNRLKEKDEISVSITEDVIEHIDNIEDNSLSKIVEPPICETSKDY